MTGTLAILAPFAILCLVLERVAPGRRLPRSRGWLARAVVLNAAQLGIVLLGGYTWGEWLQGRSLFRIADDMPAAAQGFVCWFVGTFFFYWWHRARHESDFLWRVLHQVHHSASRIETLTSFYKHPLEIALNSLLSSAIVFVLLGASVEAALWYSVFAALGEFYYHMNVGTPRWTGWFLQRPEHHSIHHRFGVHRHNYGDITWWDRLFGTFREAEGFAPRCGYRGGLEQRLGAMLAFQDVNASPSHGMVRPAARTYDAGVAENKTGERDAMQGKIHLTKREAEVLRLLARGCTYAQAAAALGVSLNTVASHLKSAYRKLDAHTAAGAVMRAMEMHLLGSTKGGKR